MKFIALLSLIFAFNTFAVENTYDCKKLISGNANGKAYITGKFVDFTLKVDTEAEDAEVRGTIVKKAGQYSREGDIDNIWAFFTDGKKFKRQSDIITITSFNRNLIMCNMTLSPCRHWESMVFNTKTKEGTLELSHSYSAYFGEVTYNISIKFSCSRI